ncbi:MAG: GNAT family N-acetyltransferase, partial [Oceanobacter sp.]
MTIQIQILADPASDLLYLNELLQLVDRASQNQASPYLYPNGPEFYEGNLAGATQNVLAWDVSSKKGDTDEIRLVGYAALRSMSPWPAYMDAAEFPPEQCALMLLNLVDPDYRGMGIGKQLAEARIQLASEMGYRHLYVTVHPDNQGSVKVLEKQGFQLLDCKPMF